ncbi:MAG: serine/threonine protein kinase [Gemmatimonadetes bacterium]|nr:serine/threonine protein kinase [Gemmatimonadota bacterium]
MDPDRYERVKRLLLAARELPPAARATFLDRECAGDDDLRREIESLLPHDSESPSILEDGALERDIGDVLAGVPEGIVPPAIPEHIGPWQIVGILGEGGMGVVYRARQETPIRREVALKLIRRGLDTDRVVARFESERRALARMEHPGIARVLDAGADAAGRPYFVMEAVDGAPITEYCRNEALAVEERLELFRLVCDAVSHAHRRGIIHRDLKPSNILVTQADGRAQPKIIDFGIAKATSESGTDEPALTQEGHMIGTPEYMSPEQADGSGNVDTRTDIYSLGVLLFELLTGVLPYRFETHRYLEIRRVLREEFPRRPSLAVPEGPGAERLARRLAGDLDNVVLKALRKEPDRRYGSVDAFAEDLRRHLEGHPVTARPDTFGYRAGKFIRRHRLAVGAASLLFVTLAVFTVALARISAEASRERDRALAAEELAREEAGRAQREAETASRVSELLENLFVEASPTETSGENVTVRELLDRGTERVEEDLQGEPDVLGRMLTVLGSAYNAVDQNERAAEVLREALRIREQSLGPDHADVGRTLAALANALHGVGDYEGAKQVAERSVSILDATLGPGDVETADARGGLAVNLQALGDLAGAEENFRRASEVFLAVNGEENDDYAWSLMSLAYVLSAEGEYSESQELYEKALAIQERVHAGPHSDVAIALTHLAMARGRMHRWAEAESLAQRSVDMFRQIYGEDTPSVSLARHNLAVVQLETGHYAEAKAEFERVLASNRKDLPPDHPYLGYTLGSLSLAELGLGHDERAESLARESLAHLRRVLGDDHPRTAAAWFRLGRVLVGRNRPDDARRAFREADRIYALHYPESHPKRQEAHAAVEDPESGRLRASASPSTGDWATPEGP